MRAYFFTNMYLIGIHSGIQTAHTVAEMFIKNHDELGNITLIEWATNHKTTIVLNGGYSSDLRLLMQFFDTPSNPYPWAHFNESEEALDGALTCVGIVLPEKIYGYAEKVRKGEFNLGDNFGYGYLTDFEQNLAERLNEYGLAK